MPSDEPQSESDIVLDNGAGAIDCEEILDQIRCANRDERRRITKDLESMITDQPEQDELIVEIILSLIDDEDGEVSAIARSALTTAADKTPHALVPRVPQLIARLDETEVPAEEAAIAVVLGKIASESPDAVTTAVPTLLDRVSNITEIDTEEEYQYVDEWDREAVQSQARQVQSTRRFIRETAISTVAIVAESCPDAVIPAIERLKRVFNDDNPQVRIAANEALSHLAEPAPEAVESAVPQLATQLTDDPSNAVRVTAARTLAHVAEYAPQTVIDEVIGSVPELFSLLESENPAARSASIGILAYVAEESPETVRRETASIVELLSDDDPVVRGNAAWTLGYAGAATAREDLHRVSEDDPEEYVRDIATASLQLIEKSNP
jgi:HEAT repeat protein